MKIDRSCDMKSKLEMIIGFQFRNMYLHLITLPHHCPSLFVNAELWNENVTVNNRGIPIININAHLHSVTWR